MTKLRKIGPLPAQLGEAQPKIRLLTSDNVPSTRILYLEYFNIKKSLVKWSPGKLPSDRPTIAMKTKLPSKWPLLLLPSCLST